MHSHQSFSVSGDFDEESPRNDVHTRFRRLRVVVPDHTINAHAHAFDEILLALLAALRRLGIEIDLTRTCRQGQDRVLVLAPHLQPAASLAALNRDAILYNWEPMGWSHEVFMTPQLTRLMRDFNIWDYSRNNMAAWRELGAHRVVHAPLAYDSVLESISPEARSGSEIDVLFYGSLNARRRNVLINLIERGMRVKWLFGVYGQERDHWISRSRLVLNLHVHEGQILELPRLAYLWANRVPVIAEINPQTEDVFGAEEVMLSAPYSRLADSVVEAVRNRKLRDRAVESSYRHFRGGPQMSDVVISALDALPGEA